LIIPLSYTLTVKYGIIGPAVANLVSFSVYNFVRFWFLWKRFNMQPFTSKTLEVMSIAFISYAVCYYAFLNMEGLIGLFVRSALFVVLYVVGIYVRKITPDLMPVIDNLKKRFGFKKQTP